MRDCDFCTITDDGIDQALIAYADDQTLAFLDTSPGHTLVIPRQHCANRLDVSEEDAAAVMVGAARVVRLLQDALEPKGLHPAAGQRGRRLAGDLPPARARHPEMGRGRDAVPVVAVAG